MKKLLFVLILLFLTKSCSFSLANSFEDEDILKGNLYRREEFNNKNESEFNKNIARVNEFRHVKSEWSVAHKCRIASSIYSTDQCYNKKQQSCFSTPLNYNFVEQTDKFGNFPFQLEFLRHFPRCWLRLAPIICLGHFRPCTISIKNIADQLYVLLEQFSMKACTNMLEHCGFAVKHFFPNFPGYLNCNSFYDGDLIGNNSNNIIYKKDCKINYSKIHPELASLAIDSFQCLWPLLNPGKLSLISDGINNSSFTEIQIKPVIDGCYLPCRSSLFDFDELHIYNVFISLFHFLIVIMVLLAICLIVAKNSQNNFCNHQKHVEINHFLPNTLHFSIFSILFFIAINSLIMAISSLPEEKGKGIIGELAICLNINGILIRRDTFKGGGNGWICALQAFILNFSSIFVNSSFLLFIFKLLMPLKKLNLIFLIFPKWNSSILPISIFLYSLICALFDLYYNQIFIDPVNGICNFFLFNNNLFSQHIFAYFTIIFCLSGLVYYINWIKYSQKKEKCSLRSNIKNNFELEQNFLNKKSAKLKEENFLIENCCIEEENLTSKRPSYYFANILQTIFNFYLNKIFVFWIILFFFRIFAGQMLINQERERELILKSINCSINRSLNENASLNWIDHSHYKIIEGGQTNPKLRKTLLGEKTSSPYCQLEIQKLGWYWIFSLLIFICHLVIIIGLLAIDQNCEQNFKLEGKIEIEENFEDERINVELLQLNKNDKQPLEGHNRRINNDNNCTIEQQQIIENDEHLYDRISSTSVNTFLPPSNANFQQQLNSPLPQLPQQQIPQNNNNSFLNNNYPINLSDAALTALYYNYYCSQYSLPPQVLATQQQQQLLCNNNNSSENECKIHHQNIFEGQQQNSQNCTFGNSRNVSVQNWMQNTVPTNNNDNNKVVFDKRKGAGSDPGIKDQQNSERNIKNRRHRLLHIRGAPKELQREWIRRRERKLNNKEENNKKCSSVGESTIFEELESLRKDRYGQRRQQQFLSPNDCQQQQTSSNVFKNNNISTNLFQNSCTTSSQQPHQNQQCLCKLILLPSPQQQNFCFGCFQNNLINNYCHNQQQPIILPSCGNNNICLYQGNSKASITQQKNKIDENKDEENEEKSISTSSETTGAEPSSSSNDEGEETNSNDFDSDSPDSFEEKRWEELTKKKSTD